ncbi:alpha-2-glucosyltransferase Alg10 [Polychytrium aggregatum]|uniref:alpha-2-glucosyltransferase Alg10 n=1 Tax=Polychytrium aggregatum TaxID=110093 RepID=UPI0022FE0443|nr:alpha-2-glucosyltransferase Alg10 [Polychytrium aggregatum]KAI9190576.1 alpha-2-glucosyltransferase Alg10 [Polychytrium aggregatum]
MAPSLSDRSSALLVATAVVLAASSSLFRVWNSVLSSNYMDEIFHVPQAQSYCRGRFLEYDPKLTTPPGLYAISFVVLKAVSVFKSGVSSVAHPIEDSLCSTSTLRSVNLVFSVVLIPVLKGLLDSIHGRHRINTAGAIAIALFPVAFFFNFMYYTDTGSTLFVLLSLLYALRKKTIASAAASLIACTFRQTNIVWMMFILAQVVRSLLAEKADATTRAQVLDVRIHELKTVGSAVLFLRRLFALATANLGYILLRTWPYLVVLKLFVAFLVWNGGIALGDKDHHIMSIHVPQLYYFCGFTLFFSLATSRVLQRIQTIPRFINIWSLFWIGVGVVVMAWTIQKFTIEHPFLLADNRHLTFYVWKNIYRLHPQVRYLLIPAYLFSGGVVLGNLAQRQSTICVLAFSVAVAITLIPSPLLEFRYFIIPFILYRLHIERPSRPALIAEVLMAGLINLATIALFLGYTFEWPSEPGVKQRFMW